MYETYAHFRSIRFKYLRVQLGRRRHLFSNLGIIVSSLKNYILVQFRLKNVYYIIVFSIMRETFLFFFNLNSIFFFKNPPISLETTTSRAKCPCTSYTIMKFELVTKNNTTYQLYDSTGKKRKILERFSIWKNKKYFANFFFASRFILKIKKKKKKIGKTHYFNTL